MNLKDKVIYPIIISLLTAFFIALGTIWDFKFKEMFLHLTKEHVVFIAMTIFLVGFLLWDQTSRYYKKRLCVIKKEKMVLSENAQKSQRAEMIYKAELERRKEEEPIIDEIRTVYRYKQEQKAWNDED